jgi:hypothetical protein
MTYLPDPIAAGQRIETLLKDDAVQAILEDVRKYNYKKFITAQTDEDRRQAQALAQALEVLEQTFRSVIDAGTLARTEQETRDRAPDTR